MNHIKKLFLLAVLPMFCFTALAQNTDNTPQKGTFTVAATVGYNNYSDIKALSGYLTEYEAAALSTDWTTKKLMIGVEGGWFFHDNWKLNLGGGLSLTNNPGYTSVPGTMDTGSEAGDGSIPSYRAVANSYSLNYTVFTGVDRYFNTKVKNLMWYTGVRAGFTYSSNEQKFDDEATLGKSMAEVYSIRGAITMGADYYILPAMYIGLQIDPVSYIYNVTSYKPQEGLGSLSADSHNVGILAAPTVKVGFKF